MSAASLTGIVCRPEGHRAYPAADRCPVCTSTDVEGVALAGRGVLESATSAGDVTIGEIRLDDGVLVLARVDGEPRPEPGHRVRFVPDDQMVRFERVG